MTQSTTAGKQGLVLCTCKIKKKKKKVLPFPEAVPALGRGNPHLPVPPATYKIFISRLQRPTSNTKHSLVARKVFFPLMKQFIKALGPAFAALPPLPGTGWRPASTQHGGGGTSDHELQFWEEPCIQSTAEQMTGQIKPLAFREVSPLSLPWADSDTYIPPPADLILQPRKTNPMPLRGPQVASARGGA